MAKGLTHAGLGLVIGIAYGIAEYFLFGKVDWYIPLIAIFYSLLPDIDHKTSYITWFFLFASWVCIGLNMLLKEYSYILIGFIILTITLICTSKFIPHRGPTHTLWFTVLTPLLLLFIPGISVYALGVATFAYFSHLCLDKIPFKISFRGA